MASKLIKTHRMQLDILLDNDGGNVLIDSATPKAFKGNDLQIEGAIFNNGVIFQQEELDQIASLHYVIFKDSVKYVEEEITTFVRISQTDWQKNKSEQFSHIITANKMAFPVGEYSLHIFFITDTGETTTLIGGEQSIIIEEAGDPDAPYVPPTDNVIIQYVDLTAENPNGVDTHPQGTFGRTPLGILWFKSIGDDDQGWGLIPVSAPDGTVLMDLILSRIGDLVPLKDQLVIDSCNRLLLGDGIQTGGDKFWRIGPSNELDFFSLYMPHFDATIDPVAPQISRNGVFLVHNENEFNFNIASTTGYCRVVLPDGTLSNTFTASFPNGSNIVESFASPYDNSMPKGIIVYPTDSLGEIDITGEFTKFTNIKCSYINFGKHKNTLVDQVAINIAGRSLDMSDMSLLTSFSYFISRFSVYKYNITEMIDLGNCPLMQNVTILGRVPLKYLNIAGSTQNLSSLTLGGEEEFLVSIENIDEIISFIRNSINIFNLIYEEKVTSIDFTDSLLTSYSTNFCPNLAEITLNGSSNMVVFGAAGNTSLTSIRAVGVGASLNTGTGSVFIQDNPLLDAAAINQLFTDLEPNLNNTTLDVRNNLGSATCDPTIATAKGYIVLN